MFAAQWYISAEQGGLAGNGTLEQQMLDAQEIVAQQDDIWRAAISPGSEIHQISFGI